MRAPAASFFTYPALEVSDISTNTALTLAQFLFWGHAGDPVMDNKDKKGHCCKDISKKE